MLSVARAPKVIVLDDEQRVPVQRRAHERNEARGDIRVDVHARMFGNPFSVRS
jgi:hypothetical protein